ncbi:MAG TPA: aspartate--tRNA ligase [Clostridiaceae bacterium]|nr:aspartate--tRNA ligase [Clostridiaceae bacterium]
MRRTDYCGLMTEEDIGREVTAAGWVANKRDMGGVVFIDLVDHTGVLQIVFNPQNTVKDAFMLSETVRNQSVIAVKGLMRLRDEETINPKINTGTIELQAETAKLLSAAGHLPFNPVDDQLVREDLRLQYRFLDLRSERMQRNLRFRHRIARAVRNFMDADGFIEVETPMLTKSTPEGARDYLVPSRVHQGSFYALPQSPQIFKQLLMAGGVDKYYQIARCFRDEDLRADRQPEFTQLDLEMAFVDQEDVLVLLERLFKYIMREEMGIDFHDPFPRLTWQEAMDKYGTDKPDLRFDLPICELTDVAAESNFSIFKKSIEQGGVVRALVVPGQADFTRSTIDELTEFAIEQGAGGMAWIAWRPDGEIYSILTKYFSEESMQKLLQQAGAKPGDFILFSADKEPVVCRVLGAMRNKLADLLDLRDQSFRFLIVTDFPMFEYSETEKRYISQHHPFTMPYPEDINKLEGKPEQVRSQAYDFVLNGVELGSGSIRVHDSKIQRQIFTTLGLTDEETDHRFGFILSAFAYGTPPHGGFAFGLDRLVMILLGEDSLREVIAFPKTKDASDPLTGAPDIVDQEQLDELGLAITADAFVAGAQTGVSASGQNKYRTADINVERIAEIARLSFDKAEMAEMKDNLHSIIDWAHQLEEIDTEDLPPTENVYPLENVFQSEEPLRPTPQELLANAPVSRDGCFFVPEVIAQEED